MNMIWINVPGPAKSAQGKSKKRYTSRIQDEARKHCQTPFAGEVTVLLFYVMNKNQGQEPDLDNLTKVVLDALKGIAYSDDHQISHFRVQRFYCGGSVNCSAPALPSTGDLSKAISAKEECTLIGVISPTLP